MELGAFSISLAVKDLQALREFYDKLGFTVFAGEAAQSWLIMKNGDHTIGLFEGMFERNMLTFNPGWNTNAGKLDTYTDIRDLQRQLKANGVELVRRLTKPRPVPPISLPLTLTGIRYSLISMFDSAAGGASPCCGSRRPRHWTSNRWK